MPSGLPNFKSGMYDFPQLKYPWKRISRGEVPKDNQPVFYYFDISGKIYSGFYEKCKQPEFGTHVFYGDHGFLTDDVDLWMPRNEGDKMPEIPEAK